MCRVNFLNSNGERTQLGRAAEVVLHPTAVPNWVPLLLITFPALRYLFPPLFTHSYKRSSFLQHWADLGILCLRSLNILMREHNNGTLSLLLIQNAVQWVPASSNMINHLTCHKYRSNPIRVYKTLNQIALFHCERFSRLQCSPAIKTIGNQTTIATKERLLCMHRLTFIVAQGSRPLVSQDFHHQEEPLGGVLPCKWLPAWSIQGMSCLVHLWKIVFEHEVPL